MHRSSGIDIKDISRSVTMGPDPFSLICLATSVLLLLPWVGVAHLYFLQNALQPCRRNHYSSTSECLTKIKTTSFFRYRFWNMSLIRAWADARTSLVYAHVSKNGSNLPLNTGRFCVYICLCVRARACRRHCQPTLSHCFKNQSVACPWCTVSLERERYGNRKDWVGADNLGESNSPGPQKMS